MSIQVYAYVGAGGLLAQAVRNVSPAQAGGSFAFPGMDQAGLTGVYLPAAIAILALFPSLGIPNQRLIAGGGMLALAAWALYQRSAGLGLNLETATDVVAPAVGGAKLLRLF